MEISPVLELLWFYAERLYPVPGLRPGNDPLSIAYRTGKHDSIETVLHELENYASVEEALTSVRGRFE